MAGEVAMTHTTCLKDEAAAYSILARNSALEHIVIRRSNPAMSTSLLSYTTKTQAALRRRLALMNGSETPQLVFTTMWSTCFLASAEMIVNSPTTDFHFRALSKLVMRYVELTGKGLEIDTILNLVYVVMMRSTATLSRPVLDMANWFPRLCHEMWYMAEVTWFAGEASASSRIIHGDVKDEVIRKLLRSQSLAPNLSANLVETCHDPQAIKLLCNTVRSQELYRNGQMLSIAVDALEKLRRTDVTREQLQDESARACLSLSVILWLRLTSATTFFGNAFFDTSVYMLPHLKSVLANLGEGRAQKKYRESQFWALFVAVQSELHRKHVLGMGPICGAWFMQAFRDHTAAMQIQNWQEAVRIFECFLFTDGLRPHISEWWHQVISDEV